MAFRLSRLFVSMAVALLLALSSTVAITAAQDAPAEIDFRINKIDCPSDPGPKSVLPLETSRRKAARPPVASPSPWHWKTGPRSRLAPQTWTACASLACRTKRPLS
jgi:hypothetical protein